MVIGLSSDKATKLILWFEELTKEDVPLVGGKNANLGEMIKASQAADVVGVEFSTNMPLKLDFELPSGRMTYYLAPRMEAE